MSQIPRVAHEVEVQKHHGDEYDADPGKHDLGGQVPIDAAGGFVRGGRFLEVGNCPAHSHGQLLSHFEQSIGSPDEHAADRDWTYDRVVNSARQKIPGERVSLWLCSLDIWPDGE